MKPEVGDRRSEVSNKSREQRAHSQTNKYYPQITPITLIKNKQTNPENLWNL